MPEKPEVMAVVKDLKERILNKTITKCNVYWNNIISEPDVNAFKNDIVGEKIKTITTRGKFIVIELCKYSLLIHLRMEGKFFFRNVGDEITKHDHVEFILDNSISMRYNDVRKFGKMYLILKENTYKVKPLVDLGYDYYDKELNGTYLLKRFKKKQIPIKTVLLDQSIISGIGNIYDDEILYKSKIHPLQKASTLNINDCNEIVENTKIILSKAADFGGTTIHSFTSSEGVQGSYQNELLIHGKKTCPKCKKAVTKIKLNGRGTYYCEECQKLKK